MYTMFRMSALRTAALSAALLVPAASAFANDEYGTSHESVIRQAAASAPSASLSVAQTQALQNQFKVGQNDAFGGSRSSQLSPSTESYTSRIASTGPSGMRDVVGMGGEQDALATEIFHPGSGTDW